jgi:hypothetical protein
VTDLSANPQQAPGGHNTPAPVGAARPGYQGVVVTIGDVLVTLDSVLVPQGRFPLAGTTWTVRDTTTTVATTPKYARVLAGAFGVLLVPLLLLRIKEHHYAGSVQVTVVGEGLYHTVSFPPGPESRAHVAGLVNQARALAAAASSALASPVGLTGPVGRNGQATPAGEAASVSDTAPDGQAPTAGPPAVAGQTAADDRAVVDGPAPTGGQATDEGEAAAESPLDSPVAAAGPGTPDGTAQA